MSAYLFTDGKFQAISSSGPVALGKLYTYAAGGLVTPLATYTDQSAGTQNANPVVLDSEGRANVWLSADAYRMVLTTAAGVTIWDVDNITVGASSQITFIQAGTGAVSRSAQDKMRDEVHAKDFGAVGSGDETAELKACFDYAIPLGRTVVLTGAYTISGPITASRSDATIAAGSLHIRCDGDVTITVDSGASGFTTVIGCYTTAANNASVKGGRLTIDCASKAANGLFIRHLAASWSGVVSIDNLKTINCKNTDAASAAENSGITVYGRYETVHLDHPIVYNVSRTNTAAGACCGITVSDFQGQCTIDSPYVANVLCTGATADADGIRVFGYATGTTYQAREGYAQINDPVCVDCQGRSIKLQAAEAIIYRPRCYRQFVVSISTADIDSQTGGDTTIIEPLFQYKKNGGVSPLDANFYPISMQPNNSSIPNTMAVLGGTLRSEVAMVRLALPYIPNTASLGGEFLIEDMECQSFGALAGSAIFSRAVIEWDQTQVDAAAGSMFIAARRIRGNFSGVPLLGYTNGAGAATSTKLSFEAVGNENAGADSASSKVFASVSGTVVTSVTSAFKIAGNAGFNDYMGTWNADVTKLKVGCVYTYDRATSTLTNGPSIAAGTYCQVEVLGALTNAVRNVRVTLDSGVGMWQSRDESTWGVIRLSGSGDPATVWTAQKGAIFSRTDGSSTSTRAYINTDGATAWTAVTTAT